LGIGGNDGVADAAERDLKTARRIGGTAGIGVSACITASLTSV